jgi:formylmethanofuran dehydrogenase subunit C
VTGVNLTRRPSSGVSVDVSRLQLADLIDLDERAIGALPVLAGKESVPLGDLFMVNGGRSSTVRVDGELTDVHGLGTELRAGELIIAGDVGDRVGAGMTGGRLRVVGRAGDDAGVGMSGGTLRIDGDAGDRLGAALPGASRGMSGGEIIVTGSVGQEAGMRARRGLIAIGGAAGSDLARDIIAGTVLVMGGVGSRPGSGSKRGSIIAVGGIDVPATYRAACIFEPPFVRLLMTYLVRQCGMAIADEIARGRYRRYCGDTGVPGRGEILEWMGR